jgi:hypothetical protein
MWMIFYTPFLVLIDIFRARHHRKRFKLTFIAAALWWAGFYGFADWRRRNPVGLITYPGVFCFWVVGISLEG